jgi:CheY-like chemotaxis protein
MTLYQNILHIDDDCDNHAIFFCALKEVGYAINYVAFTNAKEALVRLAAEELVPDVIFLDLNMPGMDGLQFLSEIKKFENLKSIPVIVLSTVTSFPGIVKSVKNLGADDIITKPNHFKEYIQMLSSILIRTVK